MDDVTQLSDTDLLALAGRPIPLDERRAVSAEIDRRLPAPASFTAYAVVGNATGVFDAAYDFGEGVPLTGTPEEIGAAVTAYLKALTRSDVEEMKYGTAGFFTRITIIPEGHTVPFAVAQGQ